MVLCTCRFQLVPLIWTCLVACSLLIGTVRPETSSSSCDADFRVDHNNQNLTASQISQLNLKLDKALANKGHTHDNDLVDLDLAKFAWQKMERDYKKMIKQQVNESRRHIERLLIGSRVSYDCYYSIMRSMDKIGDMKLWATRMWNAWGKLPAPGLFEGSYTDLGSYKSCLRIQDNDVIGQAKYCTLDFQPVVPTRPRYHSITKRVLNINQLTGQLEGGDHHRYPDFKGNSPRNSHTYSSIIFQTKEEKSAHQDHENLSILGKEYNLKKGTIFSELAEKAHFFYYVNLRIGSCWPTYCRQSDIQSIVKTASSQAILQTVRVKCVTKSEMRTTKLNKHQLIAVIVLASIAMLSIFASFIDVSITMLAFFEFEQAADYLATHSEHYLEIFSLIRNYKRLFSESTSQSMTAITPTLTDGRQQQPIGRQLTCLHGLKALSMIWVIYGHSLLNTDYQSFTHAFRVLDNQLTNIFVYPTLNPNFSVDTFFLISGLLSAYVILFIDVKFNAFMYTMARYMRLTPQLIVVILMFFLLPLTGEGPLHKESTQVHAERCYKNFWVNLLYLQSYVNRRELCIVPSWWLSIEMTFTLISLGVLLMLIKRPKVGLVMNMMIIGIMTLVGTYIHYTNGMSIGYLPSIPQKYEVENEQTHWFFHRPYPHAASYFIGIWLGYILAKKSIKKLSKLQRYSGWCLCALGQIVPLCGTYYWNLGYPYSQLGATIFYNTCQLLWPISIAWVILACSLGYGGVLDVILSSKFFIPLGRITYMTYLSHILIVYHFTASIQHTLEPSALNMVYICVSNIVLSLLFGAVLSLVYEAPILNIQRALLMRRYSTTDTRSNKSAKHDIVNNQLVIESGKVCDERR